MKSLYSFLLGERLLKALLDEWKYGDKIITVFVLFCVTATPLSALVYLAQRFLEI